MPRACRLEEYDPETTLQLAYLMADGTLGLIELGGRSW